MVQGTEGEPTSPAAAGIQTYELGWGTAPGLTDLVGYQSTGNESGSMELDGAPYSVQEVKLLQILRRLRLDRCVWSTADLSAANFLPIASLRPLRRTIGPVKGRRAAGTDTPRSSPPLLVLLRRGVWKFAAKGGGRGRFSPLDPPEGGGGRKTGLFCQGPSFWSVFV